MNDKIAIYLRLSLADGDLKKGSKDESNSIENQRMLLHDYIGKQEDLFGEIVEYVDDGYTGTNFSTPGAAARSSTFFSFIISAKL